MRPHLQKRTRKKPRGIVRLSAGATLCKLGARGGNRLPQQVGDVQRCFPRWHAGVRNAATSLLRKLIEALHHQIVTQLLQQPVENQPYADHPCRARGHRQVVVAWPWRRAPLAVDLLFSAWESSTASGGGSGLMRIERKASIVSSSRQRLGLSRGATDQADAAQGAARSPEAASWLGQSASAGEIQIRPSVFEEAEVEKLGSPHAGRRA